MANCGVEDASHTDLETAHHISLSFPINQPLQIISCLELLTYVK